MTDSECERAQWLNDILQKLWPFLSQGVEALLKGILDPVFASLSSPIIPSLKVVKISLGTNAPRIVSVRSFPSRDVGCVRLDIELKWISNAEVSPVAKYLCAKYVSVGHSFINVYDRFHFVLVERPHFMLRLTDSNCQLLFVLS